MMRQLLVASFLFFCHAAKTQIVINEVGIAPMPASRGFIELYNKSNCAVDLSCYTLVFSGTSGAGNATGWTIKIPLGKSIAGCGYFLIGGTAGSAGVAVTASGYPTGGAVNSYPTADLDVGTITVTQNCVFMKQGVNAGSLPNSSGQLTLLNSAGIIVSSVSYNNGNNSNSYPLSSYLTCNASGNTKGSNNISNPGASVNNVNATFSSSTYQGIYLTASGNYVAETSLTPGVSNAVNGGSQMGCAPTITISSTAKEVCFSTNSQTTSLDYSGALNSPDRYSITWDANPSNGFVDVNNAVLASSPIIIEIPAGTAAGIYTGYISVSNSVGSSCSQSFTLTVHPLPNVTASPNTTICFGSSATLMADGALNYVWSPAASLSSGSGSFVAAQPISTTTYSVTGTDRNGCTNKASVTVSVASIPTAPTVSILQPTCNSSGSINVISPAGLGFSYSIDGSNYQTLNVFTDLAPGDYNVTVKNNNDCISPPTIVKIVSPSEVSVQAVDSIGCNSVLYNDVIYTSSTIIRDTIKSFLSNCDSIIRIVKITVNLSKDTYMNDCIKEGEIYYFNDQPLTASGDYVKNFSTSSGCDSIVHLHLVVSNTQTEIFSGCDSFKYKGVTYFSSTILRDTVRSIISNCDSIYHVVQITVNHSSVPTYISVCLPENQSYDFNGTLLTKSGNYTTHYTNAEGCDSGVHLYLLIPTHQNLTLTGCNEVEYNGKYYTTSTTLIEIIPSTFSGCDSIIRTINILVNPKPQLKASPEQITCKGNTVTLWASAEHSVIHWPGIGNGDSIRVAPFANTTYTVIATDVNGCRDTSYAKVTVENFHLSLTVFPNPVIAGTTTHLQTSAISTYQITSWQPLSLFNNQTALSQNFIADSSLIASAVGKSTKGCLDTAFAAISVNTLGSNIFIPNSFTPNEDGKNDVFRILGGEIKKFDLKIFNRWGQIIFSSQERTRGWDGTYLSKPQPKGIYIYTVSIVLKDSSVINKKGTVLLIR